MRFDLDGATYTFDDGHIRFAEFRYLKQTLGLTSTDFFTGVLRFDVEALAGCVLLTMKRQSVMRPNGQPFRVEDLDDVDMVKLIESIVAHGEEDKAAEAARAADTAAAAAAERPELDHDDDAASAAALRADADAAVAELDAVIAAEQARVTEATKTLADPGLPSAE